MSKDNPSQGSDSVVRSALQGCKSANFEARLPSPREWGLLIHFYSEGVVCHCVSIVHSNPDAPHKHILRVLGLLS